MNSIEIFLRYFLGLIIISFFLPTFIALPYTPQASFYFPFWVIIVAVLFPKTVLNVGFLGSFLFVVLHVFYELLGLYQNETYKMLNYFWPLAFSFSVIEYFKISKDYKGFFILSRLAIISILITCVTSIISLAKFPEASREMAGYLSASGQYDLNLFYLYIGIGNYYFFHNIAFFVPLIVFLIQKNDYFKIKRNQLIMALVVIFLAIYRGGFSSAFGLFIIGLLFGIFLNKIGNPMNYLASLALIYLSFNLIAPLLSPVLNSTANAIDSEFISPRLRNVAANLDGSAKFLDDKDLQYTEAYTNQLEISILAFSENPLSGTGRQGGHHFWADLLGKFGLLGFIPWIFIMVYMYNSRVKPLRGTFRLIYFHVIMSLIFIGLFKPIGLEYMFTFVAVFFPAFLYYCQVNLLRKREEISVPDVRTAFSTMNKVTPA